MKRSLLLLIPFSFFILNFSHAQNKVWDGGGADDLWSTAANWSGNTLPNAGSYVKIDIPGTTVEMDIDATVNSITHLGAGANAGHLIINSGVTLTTTERGIILLNSGSTLDIEGTYDATSTGAYSPIKNTSSGTVNIASTGVVNINTVSYGINSNGTFDNAGVINIITYGGANWQEAIHSTAPGPMTNSGTIVIEDGSTAANFALKGPMTSSGIIKGNSPTASTGRINNDVEITGGTLAPGLSIGKLRFNNAMNVTGPTTYEAEIDKTAGTSDHLYLQSPSSLANLDVVVTQIDAASLVVGDIFVIIKTSFGYSGAFNSIVFPAGATWQTNYITAVPNADRRVEIEVLTVLPVALTSFNATKFKNSTDLSWSTASEINNEGFQIQRSNDGRTWTDLGFVKGNNNSSRNIEYRYTDETPSTGLNYYRLKQIDFDGAYEFSDVRSVNMEGKTNSIVVYPNPTNGIVNFSNSSVNEALNIKIYNQLGVLVKEVTTFESSIDIQSLPNGSYTMNMLNGSTDYTTRLVKN